MNEQDKQNVIRGERFFLDLKTGFIMGSTPVLEASVNGTEERHRGRYVLWTAPIPKGGRVDIQAFQRRVASDAAAMTAQMSDMLSQTAAKEASTTVATVAQAAPEPAAQAAPAVSSGTVGATIVAAPAIIAEPQAPVSEKTPAQRMAVIMEKIPSLKAEDFTTVGLPKVNSLSTLCQFDVEGSEREAAWAEFKKANPAWQPQPAAA